MSGYDCCPQCGGELFANDDGLDECIDCGNKPGPKRLAERFPIYEES